MANFDAGDVAVSILVFGLLAASAAAWLAAVAGKSTAARGGGRLRHSHVLDAAGRRRRRFCRRESIPARFARAALLLPELFANLPLAGQFVALCDPGSRKPLVGIRRGRTAGAGDRWGHWAARPARTTPQPWLSVGWFWFLGTLVPTIGLVQVVPQVLADRFLYLPQIGLWIAVVWTSAAWAGSHPPRTWTLIAATAFVLVLFTVAAWRQTACWQNSETLWTQAIVCDEQNSDAHIFMGLALHEQHRDDLAEEHLRAAVRADPDSRSAYGSLGWLLEEKGNLDAAVRCYTEAIDHFKNAPEDEYSLGMVLWKKGDLRGAESHSTRAIELRGDFAQARVGLAQSRQRLGAGDEEVVRLCREALEIDPALAERTSCWPTRPRGKATWPMPPSISVSLATWPPTPANRIWPPIFSGGWIGLARARRFTTGSSRSLWPESATQPCSPQ